MPIGCNASAVWLVPLVELRSPASFIFYPKPTNCVKTEGVRKGCLFPPMEFQNKKKKKEGKNKKVGI